MLNLIVPKRTLLIQLVILQHHSLNQWFTKWYNREIQDKSYTRVLNLDWNIQTKEQKNICNLYFKNYDKYMFIYVSDTSKCVIIERWVQLESFKVT